MTKLRIGVLCPSEIAFRRFMPALKRCAEFEFKGVAHANELEWFGNISDRNNLLQIEKEHEKAETFFDSYGGRLYASYGQMLDSDDIDAVYLPLPPALHFRWGKYALEKGKHVFMEKPFTTSLADTRELLLTAQGKNLALHENYMFQYHSQLDWIRQAVSEKRLGTLRLARIAFGFPFRGVTDFRYSKALGGGALLDCGGYTVKLATMLLGSTARVTACCLNTPTGFDVDIYGSATMQNDDGLTVQLSFGMDNSYKCDLELWGSEGCLYTNRILTAPNAYEPTVEIRTADGVQVEKLSADDSFYKSIQQFYAAVQDKTVRNRLSDEILKQSVLIEDMQRRADNNYANR